MSIEDKAKASAKNVEGKLQEFVGNVTGDSNQQMEGQAKQAEAQIRHTAENTKDSASAEFDSLGNRGQATARNLEGKAQELAGEITGDPQQKATGQAKQSEARARHIVEDLKDKLRKALD
jgi:uncharacterized protein YjbJ (UPF0337 family)